MIRSIKIFSFILIIVCIFVIGFRDSYDKFVHNRIIDNVFSIDNTLDDDYLGYIYIPRFDIKRLIKFGTGGDVLDDGFVGLYFLSGSLYEHDLIILAGHNISNVFSCLHVIDINDVIFIKGNGVDRKFVVYDKVLVDEYDTSYFYNRSDELLLITCTSNKGKRLLVFLKEEL